MDPLSLAASITTLLGAGGAIGKGIHKLSALKHAPETLVQLDDEVSSMQQVVTLTQDLYRQHIEAFGGDSTLYAVLFSALRRTTLAIQDLQMLVEYELTKPSSQGNKINRLAWIRAEHKILNLSDRLRSARSEIATATSMITLASTQRLDTQFHQIYLVTESLIT
ncbi:hypothetical protein MMC30_003808 [Trapelia coarctata]|nr:hypothetical protein [Trapelia coarctata]